MSTADSPTLLKLLVQLTRSMEHDLDTALRAELDDRLRPAHYTVFRYLDPTGSRIGDLAEAAGMTQQSMGELVSHLERCGFLERRVDPTDRRARLVVLTDDGRAAVELAADHIAGIERRLHAVLGAEDLSELRRLIEQAQRALTTD